MTDRATDQQDGDAPEDAGGPETEDGAATTATAASDGSDDQQAQPQRPLLSGPSDALGQVAWLMMNSPLHKHLFLTDLEWLVLPPVMLKQFRIFRRDGMPIAYASWARLTEDAEARMTSNVRKLAPGDWNAGDRLWLIDVVAPFGGHEAVLNELKDKVFEGRPVKTIQPAPDGSGTAVVEW